MGDREINLPETLGECPYSLTMPDLNIAKRNCRQSQVVIG